VELCKKFIDTEAGPTVNTPDGFDIEDYKQQLRDRFANPGLKHRTWQFALDGSQKIPQRILETLRVQLASGGSIELISLA
ncbi:mannitol dehydrogenase family protein, partial [Saccharophagus degradans]|nr:mannitol dehydrogenase family protein [Saccharophagus degradans]